MKRFVVAVLVVPIAVAAGCSSHVAPSDVPSLVGRPGVVGAPSSGAQGSTGSAARPTVGYSAGRVAQLHAAALCLREHGVPSYQDPVLTADGHVYTDARSIQDLGRNQSQAQQEATLNALRQSCGALFATAGLQPSDESPAPPQLVQAGVRAARCLRANGLPAYQDPTSDTGFTPGHGFGLSADELPNAGALGKTDPTVQHAFTACRAELDAEIAASTLSQLAHD